MMAEVCIMAFVVLCVKL